MLARSSARDGIRRLLPGGGDARNRLATARDRDFARARYPFVELRQLLADFPDAEFFIAVT